MILEIARMELRLILRNAQVYTFLVILPIALITFLKPTLGVALQASGYPDANGSEQAVPGLSLMFGFFLASFVAFSIYRDHGWNTWNRMRSAGVPLSMMIAGRLIPYVVIGWVGMTAVMGVGWLLFDLPITAIQVPPMLILLGLMSTVSALMGLAVAAVSTTFQQVAGLSNVAVIAFAALGGAIMPVETIPSWARALAPASPIYWGMRGLRSFLLDDESVGAILLPIVVLVAFSAALALFSRIRFQVDEPKLGWV